ncbi:MAG: hypothetical protein H7645_10235 [Candidatus Heimdallarchaeota archaeon]|nr:hypothetical protein [Candidatus Heimdallarchaeota archaeon]MCK4770706.1 hypothetical protein [Candidatus Heimdallarchaeota archaeon]
MPVRIRIYGRQKEGELRITQAASLYVHAAEVAKKVAQYNQTVYELSDTTEILKEVDLKNEKNDFLNVHNWESKTVYSEANEEILDSLCWIDFEDFQLAMVPITSKYISDGLLIRFLLIGHENAPEIEFNAYGLINSEGFMPGIACQLQKESSIIFPGKLSIYDAAITGEPNPEDPFLNIVVKKNNKIVPLRIRVNFGMETKDIDSYEDLKEAKFLDLASKRNVSAETIKKMISRIVLGNFKPPKEDIDKHLRNGIGLILVSIIVIIFPPLFDVRSGEGVTVGSIIFYIFLDIFMVMALIWGISNILEVGPMESVYTKAKKLLILKSTATSIEEVDFSDQMWLRDIEIIRNKAVLEL